MTLCCETTGDDELGEPTWLELRPQPVVAFNSESISSIFGSVLAKYELVSVVTDDGIALGSVEFAFEDITLEAANLS